MALFYERADHSTGTTITVSTWPRIVAILLILVAVLSNDFTDGDPTLSTVSSILFPVGLLLIVAYRVSTWSINKELRQAMAKGSIRVSGSTWDPRKPLVYTFGDVDQAEGSVTLSDG